MSRRQPAQRIVELLRTEGASHAAMVSGDRRSVAERVGSLASTALSLEPIDLTVILNALRALRG